MNTHLTKAAEYAKAFGAFLVVLAGFAAALAASPAIVAAFPATWVAFLTAFGSAGAVAGVVYGIPNQLTPKQILGHTTPEGLAEVAIAVGPGVVKGAVHATSELVGQVVRGYVESEANNIPEPIQQQVNDIAVVTQGLAHATASTVVDDIIKGYKK